MGIKACLLESSSSLLLHTCSGPLASLAGLEGQALTYLQHTIYGPTLQQVQPSGEGHPGVVLALWGWYPSDEYIHISRSLRGNDQNTMRFWTGSGTRENRSSTCGKGCCVRDPGAGTLTLLLTSTMTLGTSSAAQWLGICLPMQGMWVQALVQELGPHTLWGN